MADFLKVVLVGFREEGIMRDRLLGRERGSVGRKER